jgi:D-tyrosyl-tRNA(Tyr) deacylase
VRLVIQRVRRASVRVNDEVVGEIGAGALVLIGVSHSDTGNLAQRMAEKLLHLRYFEDAEGRTNLDIRGIGGQLLVVSQFTLYADLRRGRRPGFTQAALPDRAQLIVERFVESLRREGVTVAKGRFGAAMAVELINDGPFTLTLDSERDLGSGQGAAAPDG